MFVFTYHKVGTVLMSKVLMDVAAHFGLRIGTVYGLARAPGNADIVIFAHSLIGFDLARYNFRGVRLVRDPRDIWVSGYLYHRHCTEGWCVNTDLSPTGRIAFPKVPLSQQHRPEPWKRSYLESLAGRSYQQNLLRLLRSEGLAFELDRYAGWTIESMAGWTPHPAVRDVSMEAISTDFDSTMTAVFTHLGFGADERARATQIAARHDIARMTDAEIAVDRHIHSRTLSKWPSVLTIADLARFSARFPHVPQALGYADAA
jgi:hypothetical protein